MSEQSAIERMHNIKPVWTRLGPDHRRPRDHISTAPPISRTHQKVRTHTRKGSLTSHVTHVQSR